MQKCRVVAAGGKGSTRLQVWVSGIARRRVEVTAAVLLRTGSGPAATSGVRNIRSEKLEINRMIWFVRYTDTYIST